MMKTKLFIVVITMLNYVQYAHAQNPGTSEQLVIDKEPPLKSIWAKGNGDFNGDGHIDFMIAGEGSVIRYENPAGSGNGEWIRHIAYSGPDVGFEGCATGDINNDGHVHIVIGGYHTHMVYLLENPGNGKGSWKIHPIGGPKSDATYLWDIAGDGKLEIITRASELWSGGVGREVYIWRQQGDDPFKPLGWRRDSGNRRDVGADEHFNIGDVDGDGKVDVVVANAWYKNNGTMNLSNWPKNTFTEEWTHDCVYPFVADINNDGRMDIVLTPTEKYPQMYKTAWYEAPADPAKKLQFFDKDGRGNFTGRLIDSGVESHLGSRVFGLDGDGNPDIVNIGYFDYQYLHIWKNNGFKKLK